MARLLGKEHPDTLRSMNNLAQTLHAQRDLAGARTLQEQVLEAMARLLGNEHPDTLNSMLNLASLYYTQNKYAKAESLHRQVLRILAEFDHRADEHPHFRTAIGTALRPYPGPAARPQSLSITQRTRRVSRIGPGFSDSWGFG
jgi:hypothetical protein